MGRASAERPQKLPEKLRLVRLFLKFTQPQMFEALNNQGAFLHPGYISLYETGERAPSLLVLLAYARITKIPMECFVADELPLPIPND